MADIFKPKLFTHTAFVFKREGKKPRQGRWLECGTAWLAVNKDGSADVFLDRIPVGGFTGHIHLAVGVRPPFEPVIHQAEPERPGEDDADEPDE